VYLLSTQTIDRKFILEHLGKLDHVGGGDGISTSNLADKGSELFGLLLVGLFLDSIVSTLEYSVLQDLGNLQLDLELSKTCFLLQISTQ
jgi:hypothetical protein